MNLKGLIPQGSVEWAILLLILFLIPLILLPEKFIYPNEAFEIENGLETLRGSPHKTPSDISAKNREVTQTLSSFGDNGSQTNHSDIPAVLTVFIMDENGDPTKTPAEIIMEKDGEECVFSAIDGKLRIELLQGQYLFRGKFKKQGLSRLTLPVQMDLEPQDDEELDLMLIPALDRLLLADFNKNATVMEVRPGSKLQSGESLVSINEELFNDQPLSQMDKRIGQFSLMKNISVVLENSGSELKELTFKIK